MHDKLISALLAALNESSEIKEQGWPLGGIPRGDFDRRPDNMPDVEAETRSENRFAATVCSGMAKVRSSF